MRNIVEVIEKIKASGRNSVGEGGGAKNPSSELFAAKKKI